MHPVFRGVERSEASTEEIRPSAVLTVEPARGIERLQGPL